MESTNTARTKPPRKPVRRRHLLDPEVIVAVEPLHAVEDRDLIDIDTGFTTMLEREQERESSPPLDPERSLEERVAAALAASTRAQVNLRALFRTVKFLGASIGGARETNDHLLAELEALHKSLNDEQSGKVPSQKRAKLLSRALSSATEQAVREREFLIREHDNFIASVVADYERELGELRDRLRRAEAELSSGPHENTAESGEYRVKP
jgi:hypothetical protein